MRKLFFCFWLFFFAAFGTAADINLAWDNPNSQAWEEVRIYEIVGSNPVLKKTVAGSTSQATITGVEPGIHVYMARSYMNSVESDDSNSVSDTIRPDEPILRIIVVELGEDGSLSFKLVDPAEFFPS